jgi:uncharacterized protein (DUF697 family)
VNTGSTLMTAVYDALGRMVEQQRGSAYTEILYSPVGKTALMNGGTLTKAFVRLPGGATANTIRLGWRTTAIRTGWEARG